MKGLQERTEGNGIFLVIKHFSLCEESKTEKPGFLPITVTNPRSGSQSTKYIKRYKGVEAFVKKLEWRDVPYEDQHFMSWKLHLDAAGVPCVLDIPFGSIVSTRFMKMAENIDFTKPVEFSAWKSADDKTAFSVKQDGVNVPQKYTRADPGDCPEPVQNRMGKWNYDAQTDWLYDRMMNIVIPKVEAAAAIRGELQTEPHNGNGHSENDGEPSFDQSQPAYIDDDDAPF